MNALKYSGIINWIKTHRFWTSVIALWGLHLLVAAMPLTCSIWVGYWNMSFHRSSWDTMRLSGNNLVVPTEESRLQLHYHGNCFILVRI
jgi:hypothetical protein